jgi:hypothetical protein
MQEEAKSKDLKWSDSVFEEITMPKIVDGCAEILF